MRYSKVTPPRRSGSFVRARQPCLCQRTDNSADTEAGSLFDPGEEFLGVLQRSALEKNLNKPVSPSLNSARKFAGLRRPAAFGAFLAKRAKVRPAATEMKATPKTACQPKLSTNCRASKAAGSVHALPAPLPRHR